MRFVILFTLLLAMMVVPGSAAEPKAPKAGNKAPAGEDLFSAPKVLRLKIELAAEALGSLRKDSKQYVKATLHE